MGIAMNRREFSKLVAGAVVAHSVLSHASESSPPSAAPFQLSVMLWTIDKERGVDRSIEIVAEAGYRGIELVSEFESWSAQDIRRIMAKMSSLGLIFDTIDGGGYTIADPEGAADDLGQTRDPHEFGQGPWLLATYPHLGQQGQKPVGGGPEDGLYGHAEGGRRACRQERYAHRDRTH
jgi:hypothetical protein